MQNLLMIDSMNLKKDRIKYRYISKVGFENPKLNFNFLDIIRKVRNQSGHPTGLEVSEGDLKMFFGNYQHFIKLAHKLIDVLPTYSVEGRCICSLSTYKKVDSELQNMFTNKTGINIDYLWEWKNYG